MKQQWEEQLRKEFFYKWCEIVGLPPIPEQTVFSDETNKLFDWFISKLSQAKAERTEEIFLKCRQDAEKELVAIQSIIKPDSFRNEDDCFDTLVEVSEKITNLVLKLRSLHLKESES